MMDLKVKDFLYFVGGNTKIIIVNGFNPENKFREVWRGKVDDINWDDVPYGHYSIEHITVVENEDWLQIYI